MPIDNLVKFRSTRHGDGYVAYFAGIQNGPWAALNHHHRCATVQL